MKLSKEELALLEEFYADEVAENELLEAQRQEELADLYSRIILDHEWEHKFIEWYHWHYGGSND